MCPTLGAQPMTIVNELLELGFRPGLRMKYSDGRYAISAEEGFDQPPPLVYVLVDKSGESVRTGRSLKQTIRQREGATEAGLNGLSTYKQNNKPVIRGLRSEILQNGPLVSYIKRCTSEEAAKREELATCDRFRGRLDKRRG